jgi:Mce-associated membrane protein
MKPGRIAAVAGLALALGFCGTGAWTYAQARGDDALAYGRERDAALTDGRRAVAVLNTLDASSKERARSGIRAWQTASTGPLRDELGRTEPRTGPSSRGTVTEAAVTALDTRAGTAKLIAAVRVEVTRSGSRTPTTDRKRLEAVLARTGPGEWKVQALSAVPLATAVEGGNG